MTKVREECFCAFCKNERKVFRKKRMSFQGFAASIVLSALLSLVFWQKLDPRALSFLVVGIVITELAVHMRWRLGMICPYCGFDPLLYKRSPKQACQKVMNFMEERKKDPMFYLSSNGYDKLARIKRIEENKKPGAEASSGSPSVGLEASSKPELAGLKSESVAGLEPSLKDELLNMPPV